MAEQQKKDWRELRQYKVLRTSASQHDEFDLCPRKWWLANVRKLPTPPKGNQVLGTVLHAVVERWLSADELGRDAKGNPVELYPEGWQIARSRWGDSIDGVITPDEQSRIKRLIQTAIENGILERLPGRQIEKQFNAQLTSIADASDNITVMLTGFVDCWFPDAVWDHKTTSRIRYAKSPEALRKNVQMLIYAKHCLLEAEKQGYPKPATITLRHNVFCTDPDDLRVRKVEVQVSIAEIEAEWNRLIDNAVKMVRIRSHAEMWSDIPDPRDVRSACNAYGGCPFLSICSGREHEATYEHRLKTAEQLKAMSSGGQPALPAAEAHPKGNNPMFVSVASAGLYDTERGTNMNAVTQRLAAMANGLRGAVQAGGGAPVMQPPPVQPVQYQQPVQQPQPQPVQQPVQQPQPVQYQQPVQQPPAQQAAVQMQQPAQQPQPVESPSPYKVIGNPPPWYIQGCRACTQSPHPGFNSKGQPCRICDGLSYTQKRLSSNDFNIAALQDGTLVWEPRAGTGQTGAVMAPSGNTPVAAEQREAPVQQPSQQPPPQQMQQAVQQPVQQPQFVPQTPQVITPAAPAVLQPVQQASVQQPAQQAETPANGNGRGRPKKGFVLCLGCAPIKGEGKSGSGRGVIHLRDVFRQVTDALGKECGRSFYDLDPFKRRDAFAARAEEIGEMFGADIVVAGPTSSSDPDYRAFVGAMESVAGMVIAGLVG